MNTTCLNVGCGQFPKEGCVNADIDATARADVLLDLQKMPYPFRSGIFREIFCDHVLEHLDDPFLAMKEFHRMLIPGGRLIVKVPHCSRGFTHSAHKRGFDVGFPFYFNPRFKGGYVQTELIIERTRLKWFAQEYLKKSVLSRTVYMASLGAGKIFDFLANISPFFCSRCWVFWVGGFEEIEFHFIKPTNINVI